PPPAPPSPPPLSLHDPLPISLGVPVPADPRGPLPADQRRRAHHAPGAVGSAHAPAIRQAARVAAPGDARGADLHVGPILHVAVGDRKSTRLNSSHVATSYAVF